MGLTEFVDTMSSSQNVLNTFKDVGINNVSAIRALLVEIYPYCQNMSDSEVSQYIQQKYTAGQDLSTQQAQDDPQQASDEQQLIDEQEADRLYNEQEAAKKTNPLAFVFVVILLLGLFTSSTFVVALALIGTFLFCNNQRYNNWLTPIIIFIGVVGLIILLANKININPTMFGDTVGDILNSGGD